MDRYLVRKDVYNEIVKAMRDRSHLTEKKITDKNGHQRTVWVRAGEEPKKVKGAKQEPAAEKKTSKPKYEVGASVNLDGADGDFKIQSIDDDGTYHVVSTDGKKGYKVSENHIKEKSAGSGKSKYSKKWMDKINSATTLDELNAADPSKEYDKIYDNEEKYSKEELEQIDSDYSVASKLWDEKRKKLANSSTETKIDKEKIQKKQVNPEITLKRKAAQEKEKEKYEYNKRMDDFYKNTGLDGGAEGVLYRQAVEKEENKQPNLRAGSRDDSIFNENDDVTFWRNGNYIEGKIDQVKEDWNGTVSLQIDSNGTKYWVETENIIKHPASAE